MLSRAATDGAKPVREIGTPLPWAWQPFRNEQSITALARLDELSAFGLPLLVGASRKRFISSITPSEPDQRLGGSIAAHVLAARNGARIIRTHDVAETVQALRVAEAIEDRR